MNTSVMEAPARRRRRKHSAEFKAKVVQACLQPGVSMASVALANGLNATMLRKWVVEAERGGEPRMQRPTAVPALAEPKLAFLPVPLSNPAAAPDIRIELQRAGTTIKVTWPSSAAVECGSWLRELLR
jgi:transposase